MSCCSESVCIARSCADEGIDEIEELANDDNQIPLPSNGVKFLAFC